jgi:hypothetical protein
MGDTEEYERAVEWAIAHGIDPDEFLRDLLGNSRYQRLRSERSGEDEQPSDTETLGDA